VLRHNIRNKLNLVLAYAEAITEDSDDAGTLEKASDVIDVSTDLLAVSQKAREFGASVDPTRGRIGHSDLVECVERAVDETGSAHAGAAVTASVRTRRRYTPTRPSTSPSGNCWRTPASTPMSTVRRSR
jgi:hypothetical protein